MTAYDKLRRRCVQALDPAHVDAGGQPFPYAMVSAAEVLALLDEVREIRDMQAKAWSEGMRYGTSRAMRMMSDESNLPLASEADNPYATQGA